MLSDKKQGVPFDRTLMRIKDITSIICNLLTICTAILTALWLSFKQLQSQADQQRFNAEIIARLPPSAKVPGSGG